MGLECAALTHWYLFVPLSSAYLLFPVNVTTGSDDGGRCVTGCGPTGLFTPALPRRKLGLWWQQASQGGRQPALNKSPGFSIFHCRIWNTLSWGRFRPLPPPPPLHCFRNLGVETPRNFEESWRKRFVATAQGHSGEASIKVCRGLHGGSCGWPTLKSSSYCIVCETGLGSLPNFYL